MAAGSGQPAVKNHVTDTSKFQEFLDKHMQLSYLKMISVSLKLREGVSRSPKVMYTEKAFETSEDVKIRSRPPKVIQ